MKKVLRALFNKETGLYLFFGVLTTIVNYLTFWVFYKFVFQTSPLVANCIAFVAATLFTYITNKIFVFNSCSWKPRVLLRELCSFVGARIFSFGFEQGGLFVCIEYFYVERFVLFGMDGVMISKIILSFIAVVINYVISKYEYI